MNRYRIHATVSNTYVAEEDITFEVGAESEDDAQAAAREQAYIHTDITKYDAELEETDIYIGTVEVIEGDFPDGRIPRCDKTIDMFPAAA